MSYVSNDIKHFVADRCRFLDHSIIVCDVIITDFAFGNTLAGANSKRCNTKQP